MSTWSPAEFAALFQAWHEAIDTPLRERAKISHEVFRRFTVILGGVTARSEGSVSFKQGSLKNMTQLVMAFGDRDTWFAFSPEQKKQWFKMVNRKSYKFVDLDRATFHAVEKLIQLQAVSKNMRVTTASAVSASTSVRVTLRRSPLDGEWEVQGAPLQSVAPRAATNDGSAVSQAYATRSSSRNEVEEEGVRPHSRVREFPFPALPTTDTRPLFASDARSIFAPPRVAGDARSIFSPPDATEAASSAGASARNDVVVFDMGDYDSDSSSDSDSDADLMEESEAVAARLKLLEARDARSASPVLAPVERPSATASVGLAPRTLPPPSWTDRSRETATQPQKRSRMALAPPVPQSFGRARSSKKARGDATLLSIVATLETQAQELTILLTEAKAARTRDASRQAANAVDTQALEREMQAIMDAIELEHAIRRSELAQRTQFEADKRRILDELARFRDARQQFDAERQAEAQARQHFLEQLALERKERDAFLELIAQDQVERRRVLETNMVADRLRTAEKRSKVHERSCDDNDGDDVTSGVDTIRSVFAEQENTHPPVEQTSLGWSDPSESASKSTQKDAPGASSSSVRGARTDRPHDDNSATRLKLR